MSDVQRWKDESQLGVWLADFKASKHWEIFDKYILEELYKAAFKAFCTVDPSDNIQVIETQKMGQMVERIRSLIDKNIEVGRLATENLRNFSETSLSEEDDNG